MYDMSKGNKAKNQTQYSKADLDKIRSQAYLLWEKRGKPAQGTALEDWVRAENELRAKGLIAR